MMSRKKSKNYFFKMIGEHLSKNENIRRMLLLFARYPEVYDIYCTELDSALSLFSKFQFYPNRFSGDPQLLINANYLRQVLDGRKLNSMTDLENSICKWEENRKLWHLIFFELSEFDFLHYDYDVNKFSGAFFVAFYRTYVLNTCPDIREKNGQVASSVEEMLAILAIAGCKTQLFFATRHWLLDYEGEGFSPQLSKKILEIPL